MSGFTPEMRAKAVATRTANKLMRIAKSAATASALAAVMPKPKPDGEFAGLTDKACAKACSPIGCVISKKPYCAHPNKGCLQGPDMQNRDAVDRLNRAKKMLAHVNVEARD